MNLIKSTVLRRRTTLARICWSNGCAATGAEMTVRFGKRLTEIANKQMFVVTMEKWDVVTSFWEMLASPRVPGKAAQH